MKHVAEATKVNVEIPILSAIGTVTDKRRKATRWMGFCTCGWNSMMSNERQGVGDFIGAHFASVLEASTRPVTPPSPSGPMQPESKPKRQRGKTKTKEPEGLFSDG